MSLILVASAVGNKSLKLKNCSKWLNISLRVIKTYLDEFCDNEHVEFAYVFIYLVNEYEGVAVATVDSRTDITVAATCCLEGQWERNLQNTVGNVDLHHPESLERLKDLVLGLMSDIREQKFKFALPARMD